MEMALNTISTFCRTLPSSVALWFTDASPLGPVGSTYRLEARVEAYNAFNNIVWDNPDLNLASANFGKVTRKRLAWSGREIQFGLRFVF